MFRRFLALSTSLSILLGAPGTGFYDAAAQVVKGPAPIGGGEMFPVGGVKSVPLSGSPAVSGPAAPLSGPAAAVGIGNAPVAAVSFNQAAEIVAEPLEVALPAETAARMTPAQKQDAAGIIKMMSKRLFTWSKFAIKLPGTIFDGRTGPIIDVGSIFKAPNDAEVGKLALPRRGLDQVQLADVRQNASFSVASQDFPGQNHVWKMGGVLQKGRAANRETLRTHAAAGLEQVLVEIPNRIAGEKPLSMRDGLRNFRDGLRDSVSLLVGLKETSPAHNSYEIEAALDAARKAYVVSRAGKELDLALYDDTLMQKAGPVVADLERQAAESWTAMAAAVRETQIERLRKEGVPEDQLPQALADAMAAEEQSVFYTAILNSPALKKLHPGLGELLFNHGAAIGLVRGEEAAFARDIAKAREDAVEALKKAHPIKSKIGPWLERKADAVARQYADANTGKLYAAIRADLKQYPVLAQEAALFEHELSFQEQAAPSLRLKLGSMREASRTFSWAYRIWNRKNWKIVKDEQTGRFYADTVNVREVSSDSFVWRARNWVHRSATYVKNGIYGLMVSNLYNGPIGLRSLFNRRPFHYRWHVDAETGALVEGAAVRQTLVSRIEKLWARRREILAEHERKDSYGIFGKNLERLGLFFVADIPLGFLAPLIVVAGQPVLTAGNVVLSAGLTATAAVWAPALATLAWAFDALVYDTSSVTQRGWRRFAGRLFPLVRALVFKTALVGVGETLVSVLAVLYHGLFAAGEFAVGGTRFGVRASYDAALFQVIKKYARIPGRDSRFFVKRVAGPGLSSDYFFQIEPDLAVVALWASVERAELARYYAKTSELAAEPSRAYAEFVAVFSALTGRDNAAVKNAPAYAPIAANQKEIVDRLDETVEPRQRLHQKLLEVPFKGHIKLTLANLERALKMGAVLAQKFYTELFSAEKWSEEQIKQFWASKELDRDDWVGLTKGHLAGVFGAEFLTPLEETDKTLRIEVKAPTLGDYARGLEEGVLPEDLENVKVGGLGKPQAPVVSKIPRVSAGDIVNTQVLDQRTH